MSFYRLSPRRRPRRNSTSRYYRHYVQSRSNYGASGEARLRPVELAHDVRRGAVVGHRVVERLRIVPHHNVARVPGVEVRERRRRRVRQDHRRNITARLLGFQSRRDQVRGAAAEDVDGHSPLDLCQEPFYSQLEKLNTEIGQLRQALAQRQELALKLQGAIEAMQLQLGEEPGEASEPDAVAEATAEVPDAEPVEASAG